MLRRAGFLLLAAGLLLLAWVAVTLAWGDPISSIYTRHEQGVLAQRLDRLDRQWAPASPSASLAVPRAAESSDAPARTAAQARAAAKAALRARLRDEARALDRTLRDGQPIGRIVIPRLGLNMIVVQGTTESDLSKGPGHYDAASGRDTNLPGMGGVIAIAGHRTTYLHPFLHIDDLRAGDVVRIEMPYGTFRYTIYDHEVVTADDWSILRRRPFEKLVLSACHPLYSASHRWVVFARLSAFVAKGAT